MSTSARLLALLGLLQTHRYWGGAELADRLEVSPRTLRRDVDRLRDLGYPVAADRGVGGGYQLRAGAALPPMVLDADEAVAVAVALRTAASTAVSGIEEASVGALAKLAQVMPPALRRRVEALQSATTPLAAPGGGARVDAAHLTTLAQACRDAERVSLDYEPHGRERASRTVEPAALVPLGRRWYLLAWDLSRADWRTFRLDRVHGASRTGERFRPRGVPGGDPAAYVQGSIEARPRPEARVRIAADPDLVRERVGRWVRVDPEGSGGTLLTAPVDDADWLVLVLSVVGAEFEVIGPPEVRDHLAARAALLARGAAAAT